MSLFAIPITEIVDLDTQIATSGASLSDGDRVFDYIVSVVLLVNQTDTVG